MEIATLYFDGGSRKGVMAYGWVLVDPWPAPTDDGIFASGCGICKSKNRGTCNQAEYHSLILGLRAAIRHGINIIHIAGDSQLIINQVLHKFKINNLELKKLCHTVSRLLREFGDYKITWIPRKGNKLADALVNQAFAKEIKRCSK